MSAQLPCDGAIGPSLKATGQLSPTLTPAASDGPLLVTVIVYWWTTPSPAVTVARPSSIVTTRSATSTTVVVSDALLFVPSGSLVGLETVAMFVWGPPSVVAGTL